ncbi:FAD/NAD(P)-binding oxidoreductase [Amycolatopsis rhabdoformis]|uniref:FAD/NAD(P)-binding oxidoreductase n=1 Tax=Amycolatopsis rhabdoformis TaxID=1448059 RepID=A0ABZ1ILB0_9PSEU|nr:FAD/NAD(P)-binding oxidoreductase [Amycolatopsis rhabdoformis]WSE34285.1 FAD/NAD(P)-binding oxidoreductase [Amycolatopsis rhabdoformis]
MPDRIVVAGAGLAGWRAAEALRAEGFRGELVLVGAETHRPYDRPPLSKGLLTGATPESALELTPAEDTQDLDVTWRLGTRVTALKNHTVVLEDGEELDFTGLVIVTGAAPAVPAGLGRPAGVHVLRTLDDARALRSELTTSAERVLVLGAGFIGCELASTCRDLGLPVAVADPLPHPLVRVLGEDVARRVERLHRERGVRWLLGTQVVKFLGRDRVTGAVLSDGRAVRADVVVIATGVRPATGWLAGSGIDTASGVRCDEYLRVLDESGAVVPGVVAAGDVASWTHPLLGAPVRVEHWTTASLGAATAARTLVHGPQEKFDAVPSFWSDQCGLRIQGVGLPGRGEHVELVHGDLAGEKFVARYSTGGRHVGSVAFGLPRQLALERRRLTSA